MLRTIAVVTLAFAGVLFFLASAPSVASQASDAAARPTPGDAIEEVLRRFARARTEGDAEAAMACVHPEVAQRTLTDHYWGRPSDTWVASNAHDTLRFIGTPRSPYRLDEDDAEIDIEIYDIAQWTASARLTVPLSDGRASTTLIHAVRYDGAWTIIDTLNTTLSPVHDALDTERDAIVSVSEDYCIGFYEKSAERVQGACHPSLSKRARQQGGRAPDTFDTLQVITHEEIGLLAQTFNAHFEFPTDARCEVDVYYCDGHTACAKMTGAGWFDYFHLVKIDGEWSVLNIMFEGLPEEEWDRGE